MTTGCNDAGSRELEGRPACVACHASERTAAAQPDHLAAGFSDRCDACHGETAWTPALFDHAGFPLLGRHAELSCDACHDEVGRQTSLPPKTCVGCHDADRSRPQSPNHLAPDFVTTCDSCHSVLAWKPVAADHTKFPLTGRHGAVTCESCHSVQPVPTTCIGCHEDDRQRGRLPDHSGAGFPQTCQDCHSTVGWKPASFAHDRMPLTGAHADTACASCHDRDPLPTTCIGCHADDRARATTPNHLDAGFSSDCAACHTSSAWKPAAFEHTTFPLTGGHANRACNDCHVRDPVPTTCIGCHSEDRSRATLPDHLQAGFSTDCSRCHTIVAWTPASFDHAVYFPLSGRHNVTCGTCHINPHDAAQVSCLDNCHEHNATQMNDTHRGESGYSYTTEACLRCHRDASADD